MMPFLWTVIKIVLFEKHKIKKVVMILSGLKGYLQNEKGQKALKNS